MTVLSDVQQEMHICVMLQPWNTAHKKICIIQQLAWKFVLIWIICSWNEEVTAVEKELETVLWPYTCIFFFFFQNEEKGKKGKRKSRSLHLIFYFCAKAMQYEMVSCSEMSINPFVNSYWNKISLEQFRKLYARSNNMTIKRTCKEK